MRYALLVLMLGCAPLAPLPQVEYPTPYRPRVIIDDATVAFISDLQQRMVNNLVLPNRETVLCLYGSQTDTTISVEYFRAPHIVAATDTSAAFRACGGQHFLGILHTHPPNVPGADYCWWDETDSEQFALNPWKLSVIACDDGNRRLLVRVKR